MRKIPLGAIFGLFGLAMLSHSAEARPRSPDQQWIAAGHLIYQQHCAACHGDRGEGRPGWQQPVSDLGAKELRNWIMKFTVKSKTISSILLPFRNAIEQAIADGTIETNPFDSIKLSKIISREQSKSEHLADPFDVDEIEKILKACERPQERNMIQFAFGTGMRISEYIALDWSSIDMKNNTVRVSSSLVDGEMKKRGKTAKSLRNIGIRNVAADALQAQQSHTKLAGGLVFLNPLHDEQWTGNKQVRGRWRRILLLAGVRYRNPYQTRHTFA